jgi:DNA-directed RNA polymerase subunit omega
VKCVLRLIVDVMEPRLDKLLQQVDSNYALVVGAAKRARQLTSYKHAQEDGAFVDITPPMVNTQSKHNLTIALEEIAQGKLKVIDSS